MKKRLTAISVLLAFVFCLSFAFYAYAQNDCNFSASLNSSSFTYNGAVQIPEVVVTDSQGNTADAGDYTVAYSNQTSANVGSYSVTVTGAGALSGSVKLDYTIEARYIRDGVTITPEYVRAAYNGSKLCPKATVMFNGVKLTEGKDYKLEWRNNNQAGNAYIDVVGINNFTGKATKCFTIVPGKTTGLKSVARTTNSIDLAWSKNVSADGYQIYIKQDGKLVEYAKVKGTDNLKTSLRLKSGQYYHFAVAAYKEFNGRVYYGAVSDIVSEYTFLDKYNSGLVLRRADNSASGQLLYHSVNGVSGYEIMYSPDPYFRKLTKSVIINGKDTITANLSGMDRSLPIYARIRVFKDTPDGRVYGYWSESVNDFYYNGKVRVDKPANTRSMNIKFERSTYGHGYQILYSETSNFSEGTKSYYSKGITDLDETITNLTANKGYYVKLRPYYVIDNEYFYGPFGKIGGTDFIFVYATYSSKYVNNADRTTNLRIASAAINGTVIQPGETFDFNVIVGPRTSARGYKKATVFTGTQGTAQELGGGICQVASTIFNTCLYADVKITERNQHSQKVSYVPLGRDAAISGSAKNFRWTNNTDFPIKIVMDVSGGVITCTFYTMSQENPGDVRLDVSKSGNTYTLRRYHNGKVDYSCTSKY